MYPRIINILKSQSFFLFGARGTGKSTFLQALFKTQNILYIDLLDEESETRYSSHPDDIYHQLKNAKPQYDWLVIDEVQKIPKLLDIGHKIIEDKKIRTKIAFTGSSARKIKKGGANLLAGRAFTNNLFPLTYGELGADFDLMEYLKWGGLPMVYNLREEEEKKEFLRSYTQTYLKEEVWSDQLVKDLAPFRRFIEVAAQMNGEICNYSKVGREVSLDTKTVQNYFSILEDTLIGFHLDAYHSSVRKRLLTAPKFYLFDTGVKRSLDKTLNNKITTKTYEFGKAFEHFIITQMLFLNSYKRLDFSFFYLKTKDGAEVDLVIKRPGKPLALVEIKSSERVDILELRNLKSFKDDLKGSEAYCLSLDKISRIEENVQFLHWQEGLNKLLE